MVTARTAGDFPEAHPAHPLAETLAHLPMSYASSGEPSARLGPPTGPGVWFSAHGLLGRQSGLIDDALAEVITPLVRDDASPMKARSWFYAIEGDRQSAYFCDRNGCCLTYKIPGTEECGSCPLRPKAERIDLMRDYLNSLP